MLVLLPAALRVPVRLCPLHTSNQADGSLISQNKTPAYVQETFICWISGIKKCLVIAAGCLLMPVGGQSVSSLLQEGTSTALLAEEHSTVTP